MAKTNLFQNKLYFHISFTSGASIDKAPCSVGYPTDVESSDDTKGIDYDSGESGVGGRATKFIRQSDAGYKYSGFRTKKRWYPRHYDKQTFCFWYKYSSADIISTNGPHYIYDVGFTSLSLTFNSNNKIVFYNQELEPDRWYHIAVVSRDVLTSADGGNTWEWQTWWNRYLNGEPLGGMTKTGVLYGDTDEIYLLGKGVSESTYATPKYTYWITDFRWYSDALTGDDMYQMAGNPLLAHFPLNKPAISGRGDSRPCFYSYAHTYYNTYYMDLMPLRYTTNPNSFSYYSPPLVTNNILYKNRYDKSAKMASGSYKYMFSLYDWTVNPDTEGAAMSFWYLKTGYGCLIRTNIGQKDDSFCSITCGFLKNGDLAVSEIYRDEENSLEFPSRGIVASGLGSNKHFSHMVITYLDGAYNFYNNGEFVGAYTCKGPASYPLDQVVFGNAEVWASTYDSELGTQWQGNFSDIKIFRRALTAEEIKILYNQDTRLEMSPNYSWHAGEIREISEEEVWIQPGANRIYAHSWIEKMPANGTQYANGVLYGGIIECKDFYEE